MDAGRTLVLEERVRTLERRQSRARIWLTSAVIVAGASLLAAARSTQPAPLRIEEIIAHRFTLIDANGRIRGYWRVDADGAAVMSQRGNPDSEAPAVGFTADPKGVGVILNGTDANAICLTARSALGYREDSVSVPKLMRALPPDANTKRLIPGALLSVGKPGRGTIIRSNPAGETEIQVEWGDRVASLTAAGDSARLLLGRGDGSCVSAVVDSGADPAISLWSGTSQRAVLGSATINRSMTGATESRPASSLMLFGNDGRILFEAPR